MIKDIRLIIFDLDGTLVNAYPAIIASFNYTMRKLKLPAQAPSIIKKAVGWGDENLLRPFLNQKDLKKGLLIYRRHHRIALIKGSSLFTGAKKVLEFLKKKKYKLAVASNRPTEFSLILIHSLRIKKYFDYVLCADKLKYGKPNPQILNKIMKRLNVLKHEALYVGDMVIDAQTGRRAGVRTIIVTTGSSTRKQIKNENPGAIIRNLDELFKFL